MYADKSVVKAAAKEFADTEAMIAAGEKLFGPYRWKRFDILVMPPSFPVGGMGNPRLSFISATVNRRRQEPGVGHRARIGAFLVGKSRRPTRPGATYGSTRGSARTWRAAS